MTIRCTSCSYYRDFGRRGEKIIKCHCGGEFEKLVHLKNGTYKNKGGELFKLEPPIANKKISMFKTIIETRGEGGFVVAPPSNGYKILSDEFPVIFS